MRGPITAADLARALGGQKAGFGYIARCPVHDDRTPSLSIADGADAIILVRCHAGCPQAAVISALRAKGLWPARGARSWVVPQRSLLRLRELANGFRQDGKDKRPHALRIWERSQPAEGTVVETYLRSRGITVAIPEVLRFHPWLKHPTGTFGPALVALITRGLDAEPIGIHRTFLALDGSGKASIAPNKMMLGAARGGAVRLAATDGHLAVGEGLETCLSILQASGQPVWAALSTSGLGSLDLPPDIRSVTIIADGDPPGEAAAVAAARRWLNVGRSVRIVRPPAGCDFNDILVNTKKAMETT